MKRPVSEPERWKLVAVMKGFGFIVVLLLVLGIHVALVPVKQAAVSQEQVFSKGNYAASARMLLDIEDYGDGNGGNDSNDGDGSSSGSTNRIGVGAAPCSKDNILVFQGATSPLPNGIPTYTVEIQNVCVSGSCSISDIHLSCGWFSSARLINPSVFRRVGYNDCLVNDGEPLNPGEALSFQYANTFKYPLSVSSVACQVA